MALDIISTINLDLKRPNTETVYAVQYDTAGRIKAQLTNDGEAWHVPTSAGGMVSFRKSDNIGGFYDTTELGEVAVSVDENDDSVIYIALDAQTTITATPLDHPVQMQINFYNSQGKRLSTFAFYLRVQASVLFDGDQDERPVASEWTFRILTGALGQTIKNQEDAIKWMADNIRTQAGYVVDDTLKVPGAAGDAKKIGELFEEIVKVSDSMPGYFPTTDTERIGDTKYYTRSGTAPNYVYTEFTGATFATGVTYYEYSPWNRIWIDPDDNDIEIPTMDELNELKSALSKLIPIEPYATGGRGINASGVITTSAAYNIWYFPVISGRTCEFTTVDSVCYYGWFETVPIAGATAYDNTRYIGSDTTLILQAPIDGYLAFRSAAEATAEDISVFLISAKDIEAEETLATISTVFNKVNIDVSYIGGRGINASGVITTSSSYTVWYCKVVEGVKYTFKTQDSAYYYAWFETIPTAGVAAYDNTRYTGLSDSIEVTAPINGYLVFRSAAGYSEGSVVAFSAIDITARENTNILFGRKHTVYVSTNGDDSNEGTEESPYRTIAKAIESNSFRIIVAPGTYEETFAEYYIRPYLQLIGNNVIINCAQLAFRNSIVHIEGFTFICDTTEQSSNLFLRQCDGLVLHCSAINATYMGFRLDGSKVTLIDCFADSSAVDGFNAHDTANSISDCTFINCVAKNCGDDGMSFHENGSMHVIGGEYANCASTGIAPHNNCNCDIRDAYIHNNGRAGIEALVGNYAIPDPLPTMVLTGCIFENNTGNAVTAEHYIVKACANGASGNSTDSIVNGGSADITTFALMT